MKEEKERQAEMDKEMVLLQEELSTIASQLSAVQAATDVDDIRGEPDLNRALQAAERAIENAAQRVMSARTVKEARAAIAQAAGRVNAVKPLLLTARHRKARREADALRRSRGEQRLIVAMRDLDYVTALATEVHIKNTATVRGALLSAQEAIGVAREAIDGLREGVLVDPKSLSMPLRGGTKASVATAEVLVSTVVARVAAARHMVEYEMKAQAQRKEDEKAMLATHANQEAYHDLMLVTRQKIEASKMEAEVLLMDGILQENNVVFRALSKAEAALFAAESATENLESDALVVRAKYALSQARVAESILEGQRKKVARQEERDLQMSHRCYSYMKQNRKRLLAYIRAQPGFSSYEASTSLLLRKVSDTNITKSHLLGMMEDNNQEQGRPLRTDNWEPPTSSTIGINKSHPEISAPPIEDTVASPVTISSPSTLTTASHFPITSESIRTEERTRTYGSSTDANGMGAPFAQSPNDVARRRYQYVKQTRRKNEEARLKALERKWGKRTPQPSPTLKKRLSLKAKANKGDIVVSSSLATLLGEIHKKRERVMDVFRRFDTNGDGSISSAELSAGLRGLGIAFEKRELEELFATADADGSESLSFVELVQTIKKAKRQQSTVSQ